MGYPHLNLGWSTPCPDLGWGTPCPDLERVPPYPHPPRKCEQTENITFPQHSDAGGKESELEELNTRCISDQKKPCALFSRVIWFVVWFVELFSILNLFVLESILYKKNINSVKCYLVSDTNSLYIRIRNCDTNSG